MKRSNIFHLALVTMAVSVALGQDKPVATPATLIRSASENLRKGEAASAETQLRKAIKLGTKDPLAYNLLGFICDQSGRPDEAISEYQTALRLAPGYNPARNNLGALYLRQGKSDLALGEFQQTLKANPQD